MKRGTTQGKAQASGRSLDPVVRLLNRRDYIRSGDERIHTDDWPGYFGRERWVPVERDLFGEKYDPIRHPPVRRNYAKRNGLARCPHCWGTLTSATRIGYGFCEEHGEIRIKPNMMLSDKKGAGDEREV